MAQQSSSTTSFLADIDVMVNKRRWKQVITDLVAVCGHLIDCKGLRGLTPSITAKRPAVSNDKNGPCADGEELTSFVKKLRQITASIDCKLLEFEQVDPAKMWASTFCTPIMEYPDFFEMSIFGFRFADHSIPLHDHPNMYGFIRPLHGRVRVTSYSWLRPNEEKDLLASYAAKMAVENGIQETQRPGFVLRPARYEGQFMLSPPSEQCCESEVAMLEPNKVNVHMIEALDDGAAFFDLLVPGYHSENRPCTYYNIINDNQPHPIGDIVWLEGSENTPEHFTMQRI